MPRPRTAMPQHATAESGHAEGHLSLERTSVHSQDPGEGEFISLGGESDILESELVQIVFNGFEDEEDQDTGRTDTKVVSNA